MSVTYEKLSTNRAKLSFKVSVEKFEEGMQTAYRKMVKQLNVPGFRRGKAPRKVIESIYGESVFYEDAFNSIFPDIYEEALNEHGLTPVDQPELEMGDIGEGKPLAFSLEVYVRPDVKLGEYKGLTAPIINTEVNEELVNEQVEQARERVGRWVEADRPAQDGDRAIIDYLGSVDGVPFAGGQAEGFALDIGSGTFIEGFEEKVIGMVKGEERDINVTFPTGYRAQDLAGKDAVFHIVMHDVKTRELPELDDEFAMDVSEFDTLDEYKADIRAKLEKSAKEKAERERDDALVEALINNCEIDVPQAMVERQINMMLRDFQINLAMQGISMDNFIRMTGQTPENMRAQYSESALIRVKGELALEAVHKAEQLEADEAEIEAEIVKFVENTGRDLDEFKAGIQEDDMEYFKGMALSEKVLKILRENAVYVEKAEVVEDEAEPQE